MEFDLQNVFRSTEKIVVVVLCDIDYVTLNQFTKKKVNKLDKHKLGMISVQPRLIFTQQSWSSFEIFDKYQVQRKPIFVDLMETN